MPAPSQPRPRLAVSHSSRLEVRDVHAEDARTVDDRAAEGREVAGKGHEHALGNYASYYNRRNGTALADRSLDSRLSLVPSRLLKDKRVLDVGCNTGAVAIGVALYFRPRYIEGVDVDPRLVARARANWTKAASRVNTNANENQTTDYFPVTAPLQLMPLPIIALDEMVFPANVSFRLSDFLTEPLPTTGAEADKFDTVLALSITKWIHVRHGDAGLKLFFKKCYSALKRGGCLILEPQPWVGGGYERAASRGVDHVGGGAAGVLENSREHNGVFSSSSFGPGAGKPGIKKSKLELRPDEFPTLLMDEIGFTTCEKLGESPNPAKGFRREVFCFTK
ncbi:S-adenosyl-L-methionine-dependent methyltransferase [Chytriomyces sp. MP71]|nr:S-adenosyl-L-methionine-dependent methyltransferase [Chytriomyces sp. MP71]